jgi:Peptidase family M23
MEKVMRYCLNTGFLALSLLSLNVLAASLPLPKDEMDKAAGNLTKCHHGDCSGNGGHNYWAVDLMVNEGTDVHAIAGGTVIRSFKDTRCGNMVRIQDANGFNWLYCHGSERLVNENDPVSDGQVIMKSGNTGISGEPHLHVEVKLNTNGNSADWKGMYPVCVQPTLVDMLMNGNLTNPRIVGTSPERLGDGCINP